MGCVSELDTSITVIQLFDVIKAQLLKRKIYDESYVGLIHIS